MRFPLLPLVLIAAATPASRAATPDGTGWPEAAVRLVAADAAVYAPPDLKRQLVKHRDRLMAGASGNAAEAARLTRREARDEAVRRARAIARGVPARMPFWDVAREAGAIAAFAAASFPPPPPPSSSATKGTSFSGYGVDPFGDPAATAALPLAAGTDREAFDAAVTLSTRLLAWAWKSAGGDASITSLYLEAKGPYRVRN